MTCLAIHGGAGALPPADMTPERAEKFHAALHAALLVGQRLLATGRSSLDAVEATVAALEDNPLFNAGRGSSFTREGDVEMEASILFTLGALRKVQAGCLLTVSDIVVEGEFTRISDDELRAAVDRMTRVALHTVTADAKH